MILNLAIVQNCETDFVDECKTFHLLHISSCVVCDYSYCNQSQAQDCGTEFEGEYGSLNSKNEGGINKLKKVIWIQRNIYQCAYIHQKAFNTSNLHKYIAKMKSISKPCKFVLFHQGS